MTKWSRGYLAGIEEGKKLQKELMLQMHQKPCAACAARKERWRAASEKYRQKKDAQKEDTQYKHNRLVAKVANLKKRLRKVSEVMQEED